jgi:hypothetical protein
VHEVEVLTGAGGGDCGIPFKAGEVYLVYAFVAKDELLHAGICGSTRRMDNAEVALRILRQRRDGQPVPSLAGKIARIDRNFQGPLGTRDPKPLANVLVRVKADGKAYETRADPEGLYAFNNLPSGQYEFAPDLPSDTTLAWFIGSDRPLIPFAVSAGACQERNVDVFASGSIQGRVLDSSNKVLSQAFAYIVPADEKVLPKESKLYWASQGKEGFFKFVHIPPGQYVTLVNPDDSRNPDFPYRRTFYPGVHDRSSSSIITLRGGEQIKDADIRLEHGFELRHLTVRITWADGRLIKDLVFVDAKGTVNPEAMSNTSQKDMKTSVVDLNILATESYQVQGELICTYADERSIGPGATLKSNTVYVKPGDDQTELFLAIPAGACPEIQGKRIVTEQ